MHELIEHSHIIIWKDLEIDFRESRSVNSWLFLYLSM